MIKAIIEIIKDIFWLIVRRKKQQDNPVTQIENERQQFQKAVVAGDENTVNAVLNSELQRVRDQAATGSSDSK